jgi:hypothetical protein
MRHQAKEQRFLARALAVFLQRLVLIVHAVLCCASAAAAPALLGLFFKEKLATESEYYLARLELAVPIRAFEHRRCVTARDAHLLAHAVPLFAALIDVWHEQEALERGCQCVAQHCFDVRSVFLRPQSKRARFSSA